MSPNGLKCPEMEAGDWVRRDSICPELPGGRGCGIEGHGCGLLAALAALRLRWM